MSLGKPSDHARLRRVEQMLVQLQAENDYLANQLQIVMAEQAEQMLKHLFTMRVLKLRQKKPVLIDTGEPEYINLTLEEVFYRDRDQIIASRMQELEQMRSAEEAAAPNGEGVHETSRDEDHGQSSGPDSHSDAPHGPDSAQSPGPRLASRRDDHTTH